MNTKCSASQTGVNCLFKKSYVDAFRSADVWGMWSFYLLKRVPGIRNAKQSAVSHKSATFFNRKKPTSIKFDLIELCKYI